MSAAPWHRRLEAKLSGWRSSGALRRRGLAICRVARSGEPQCKPLSAIEFTCGQALANSLPLRPSYRLPARERAPGSTLRLVDPALRVGIVFDVALDSRLALHVGKFIRG